MYRDRIILHVDFDSFFASVEQQDNPKLRGKPIAVTATNGRTAIIAASREAKKQGIPNVTRTYEAYEKCPSLIVVPARFVRYMEISKKFLKVCNRFSPSVEMFSLDEVFMDVSLTVKLFGSVDRLIGIFKRKIAAEIGPFITVSVGVSHNKLLAKLASGLDKPNGLCKITKDNIWEIYNKASLTDICGIGQRIAQRLNSIGIYTLLQLRDAKIEALLLEFGKVEGKFLKQVGLGDDYDEVVPYTVLTEPKSVGRNYALPHNEYDKRVVQQNIFELCEEVSLKLRRLDKKAKTVGLGLRGSENYFQRKTVDDFLDDGLSLFRVCKEFYGKWDPLMVRMISVWTTNLVYSQYTPISLFDKVERKSKLQKTVDHINDKFGDHTIRNGFLLYSEKLTTVPNGFGQDTYEKEKLAKLSPEKYI